MSDFKCGIEIERKYIISMPMPADMAAMSGYSADSITQTYLISPEGVTRRVRRRESASGVRYYETVKRRIDGMSAHEEEREITREEYSAKLAQIADGTRPIEKVRHVFVYGGQTFEVDVYPEWKRTAILETELPSRTQSVEFPEFIRIIREVTGIREYSNAAMAIKFPAEEE